MWNKLTEDDSDLSDDGNEEIGDDELKKKRENASVEVKEALKNFEENILKFTQNPST